MAYILISVGLLISISNWIGLYSALVKKKEHSSVFLIGGLLLAVGIAILPPWISDYWWIALLVDFGCIPGLVYAIFRWLKSSNYA